MFVRAGRAFPPYSTNCEAVPKHIASQIRLLGQTTFYCAAYQGKVLLPWWLCILKLRHGLVNRPVGNCYHCQSPRAASLGFLPIRLVPPRTIRVDAGVMDATLWAETKVSGEHPRRQWGVRGTLARAHRKSCLKRGLRPGETRPRRTTGVWFAHDTKRDDGPGPATFAFDSLVVHCLKAGCVSSCEELVNLLQTYSTPRGRDFRQDFDEVETAVADLCLRLESCTAFGIIINTKGGGSNSRVSSAVAPTVHHLLAALQETRRRMVVAGVFPLVSSSFPFAVPQYYCSTTLFRTTDNAVESTLSAAPCV